MSNQETLAERIAEFESHVWDHTADAFQQQFDSRRPLTQEEIGALMVLVGALANGESDEQVASKLLAEIKKRPEFILVVLQIVGSTRNKIITDLRAATSGSSLKVPQSPTRLHRNQNVWKMAGQYLAIRFRKVCIPLISLESGGVQALEALNQATWSGWIRQERAKRQGHEAEYRLAVLYSALNIPFEPKEKAENPLAKDAQVNDISYDLVVPNTNAPLVCVKSTVHTSNIGQYGESKDALEISEAADELKSSFPSNTPTLLAMIDGIGFRSNRAGLEGVLSNSQEFCQFKTLWKAAAIAASRLALEITVKLPKEHIESHSSFLGRCNKSVHIQPLDDQPTPNWVQAGEGLILPGNQ